MLDQSEKPTAQPWTARQFVYFKGQYDTRISTGEDYPTQALAKLFTMRPGDKPKGMGLACIPSAYHDYDAREHAAQRERGRYIALTGDVDSGDHGIDAIREGVTAFVTGSAWLIYSSPHARPGDMRWRIIIPLADEQPFEAWNDAQLAFFAFMEARGIAMDHALARAAQPVYLPNVPAVHAKSEAALRNDAGDPLYFVRDHSGQDKPGLDIADGIAAQGIAALRHKRLEDERAREAIRREAEARRAASPRGEGATLIEDFNAENSVATMLEICGYEQCPRNAEDWRSPHQTGETFATRIIGSKWVSLSASDTAARIGSQCASGCYGDAYDLFVHYKHGGDHKAAFRALHAEKRAAQGKVQGSTKVPDQTQNETGPAVAALGIAPDAVKSAYDMRDKGRAAVVAHLTKIMEPQPDKEFKPDMKGSLFYKEWLKNNPEPNAAWNLSAATQPWLGDRGWRTAHNEWLVEQEKFLRGNGNFDTSDVTRANRTTKKSAPDHKGAPMAKRTYVTEINTDGTPRK